MSRDLFKLEKGLHILTENEDTGVQQLFGANAPGGESVTIAAEAGSVYLRTNGSVYIKTGIGGGDETDWRRLADTNDISALEFRGKLLAVTAHTEPGEAGTIDFGSVQYSDDDSVNLLGAQHTLGDYVLFQDGGTEVLYRVSAIATNVVTYTKSATHATYPVRALVAGDNYVVENYLPDSPDAQEKQVLVHWNGTDGIKIGDFNWDLASGIGLDSGYAAAGGNITNADTVLTAIQKLDDNLDDVNTSLGTAQGATHLSTFTGSIIADNLAVKPAIQALETDLEALQTAVGIAAEAVNMGTYTGSTITDSQTAKQNIQELETALEGIQVASSETGVTTVTTLDQVLVDDVRAVEWYLCVELVSDTTKRKVMKIHAIHDGVDSGADAANVDDTVFGKIKVGSSFNTTIAVDLNGATTSQYMRLRITASAAVNAYAIRRIIAF